MQRTLCETIRKTVSRMPPPLSFFVATEVAEAAEVAAPSVLRLSCSESPVSRCGKLSFGLRESASLADDVTRRARVGEARGRIEAICAKLISPSDHCTKAISFFKYVNYG